MYRHAVREIFLQVNRAYAWIAAVALRVRDACSALPGMVIATATAPRAPVEYVSVLDARSGDRRLHV